MGRGAAAGGQVYSPMASITGVLRSNHDMVGLEGSFRRTGNPPSFLSIGANKGRALLYCESKRMPSSLWPTTQGGWSRCGSPMRLLWTSGRASAFLERDKRSQQSDFSFGFVDAVTASCGLCGGWTLRLFNLLTGYMGRAVDAQG